MIKFKLKQLRLQHNNMTQKELIDLSKIRSSTISAFENDTAISISIEQIDKLCQIFRCNPNDLMEYIPNDCNTSNKLFDLRIQNGLSENEVACKIKIDDNKYRQYEKGLEPTPLKVLLKLCKLYNVPQSYFGINSDLVAVGNKGYVIKNTETSEVLEVTDEEFKMLKSFLEAYKNK